MISLMQTAMLLLLETDLMVSILASLCLFKVSPKPCPQYTCGFWNNMQLKKKHSLCVCVGGESSSESNLQWQTLRNGLLETALSVTSIHGSALQCLHAKPVQMGYLFSYLNFMASKHCQWFTERAKVLWNILSCKIKRKMSLRGSFCFWFSRIWGSSQSNNSYQAR